MKLIDYSCEFCGATEYTVLFRGRDLLTNLPGEFQFVRCNSCGLIRQNPRMPWEELNSYYLENYTSYAPLLPYNSSLYKRLIKRFGSWKRVHLISSHKSQGSWIDVGCGSGHHLQEAQFWNKWELFGLEPNERIAKKTEEYLHIPIAAIPAEKISSIDRKFDIITMWEVLEHVAEPNFLMSQIYSSLNDSGIFVFSTPNWDSFNRKIFKEYWTGFDLPRHLFLFPSEVLRKMLEQSGFRILQKKCVAGSFSTLTEDIKFYSKENNHLVLNKLAKSDSHNLFLKAITFLPLQVLDMFLLGPHITYVCEKTK